MAEEKSRLHSANPALLARLELASKQFSKQLDEDRYARDAEWLVRAEADGQFYKSLLALAQKENPELRPALEAVQRLRFKRIEQEKRASGSRVDPSLARLLRSGSRSPNFTLGSVYSDPFPPGYAICSQLGSWSVNSFDMSWTNGTLAPFGSFSPVVGVLENAFNDAPSTASGTTMLGTLWAAPVSGVLQFKGTGTYTATYMLDCQYAEAEVDIHIGTSFWDIGPNNLNAPVSIANSGDQQVWGNHSNFTNQDQISPMSSFEVGCVGSEGGSCGAFRVTADQFYILWIYFRVNAFQGAGANQVFPWTPFAMSSGILSALLNSIEWTVSKSVFVPGE